MMNSNRTSRIVIGVGLLAIFGVGASIFAVRAKHESEVARNAPAPAPAPTDQSVADATAAAQNAAVQPTDQTVIPSGAPPAVAPVVAPTPVARTAPATSDAAKAAAAAPASEGSKSAKSKASDRAERRLAKTRSSSDTSGTRVASADNSVTSTVEDKAPAAASIDTMSSDTMSSAAAGVTADRPQALQARQETATASGAAATANEPVASDSQITTDVKSEIATATPTSNVDVTTTNGVVALAGSAPSQDAVDQARHAAQRVGGVKSVDASALTVSNQ
jgi:osmotically-inducible protein OsmY